MVKKANLLRLDSEGKLNGGLKRRNCYLEGRFNFGWRLRQSNLLRAEMATCEQDFIMELSTRPLNLK